MTIYLPLWEKQSWKHVSKSASYKLSGVIRGLLLYNIDYSLTSLNFYDLHWMIFPAVISNRIFKITYFYNPACSQVHKSSDMTKMGLQFKTKA